MRTLASTLVFAAVLAAAARAQSNDAAAPLPLPQPAPVAQPLPPGAGANPFRTIDPAIKELAEETGERMDGCAAALNYLRADLAATKRRLKARYGGKIPLNQGGLIAAKVKRVGRQQVACLDLAKTIGAHFDIVTRSLAGVEPSNHPGIPPRRKKIAALREKFNAAIRLKDAAAAADGAGEPGQ